MNTLAASPVITPADRLGLTFCLAVLAHAIVILGITFTGEDPFQSRYETMEIVLVQQNDPDPVKDAQLIAQANLAGGGDTEHTDPATPLPPPFPAEKAAVTSPPVPPSQPPAPVTGELEEVTPQPQATPPEAETLAVKSPEPDTPVTPPEPPRTQPERNESARRPIRSAAELLRKSFEIASLSARIERKLEQKAHRPRRTYISASTRASVYAAYMDAWRAKVERVGNLNYPEEARKRRISGSLVLEAALNADGSINDITIVHSSGFQVLDDAAIRTVRLAAPFAPFPDEIRKQTDILHITRTWRYAYGSFR